MEKFKFEFGKYGYLRNGYYKYYLLDNTCLEALLYDAVIGVNLSIVYIVDYYQGCEREDVQEIPQIVKKYVLNRLNRLTADKIKPNAFLNPLGGKPLKRFYPTDCAIDNLSQVRTLKTFKGCNTNIKGYKKAMQVNKALKDVGSKMFPEDQPYKIINLGLRTLEKDMKLLDIRKNRLDSVSKILNRFYPLQRQRNTLTKSLETEKDTNQLKEIQFKLETIEFKWQSLINQLDEIYKNPVTLV